MVMKPKSLNLWHLSIPVKNKMILATKRADYVEPDQAVLAQIQALKDMYGIQKHSLELLLNDQWDQQDIGCKC